jgi:hypothetical protein
MQHDAWFFVGVFVFIFVIWILTGGPTHPIAFSGPTLAAPQQIGGGTYLSFPTASFGFGGGQTISLPGSSSGNGGSGALSLPTLVGGTFGTASPYYGIVTLSHGVSSPGATDPKREYVTLRVSGSAQTPVDITGWTLESDTTGNASVIPKGTELPRSGVINAAQDIVLTPGEQAIIISGQSPIGASFRENECIGYLSSFQTFYPSLPQTCPDPSTELTAHYGEYYIRDASCIDYVDTIPRCKTVLTPPTTLTGVCQSFLVKYLNYNGCVTAHQADADFKGDTWRVYLGRSDSMFRTKHEIVKLLDKDGKTVDAFSY